MSTPSRRRIALSPTPAELQALTQAAGRLPVASWVLWAAMVMARRLEGATGHPPAAPAKVQE